MTFCALPPATWPDDAVEGTRLLLDDRCINDLVQAPTLQD